MSSPSISPKTIPLTRQNMASLPLAGNRFDGPTLLMPKPIKTFPVPMCLSTSPSPTLPCCLSSGEYSPEPASPAPSSSTAAESLSTVNEEIYSIVEKAVEQKMADAMAPLRLNTSRMDFNINRMDLNIHRMDNQSSHIERTSEGLFNLVSQLRRENADLREQNDTMSRQLDLHYRRIEQHTDTFAHMLGVETGSIQALANLLDTESGSIKGLARLMDTESGSIQALARLMDTESGSIQALDRLMDTESANIHASADNLAVTANLIGQLSQILVNLPVAVNQVVHNAVQHQSRLAFEDILEAQREFILSIQHLRKDMAGSRSSSSIGWSSAASTTSSVRSRRSFLRRTLGKWVKGNH